MSRLRLVTYRGFAETCFEGNDWNYRHLWELQSDGGAMELQAGRQVVA
jgi:hypothetical protein